jgi:hypothetical protein
MHDRGNRVRFQVGARHFSLLRNVQTDSGPSQFPIRRVQADVSRGVRRPGHEAEIKNDGVIPHCLMRFHGLSPGINLPYFLPCFG